MTGSVHHQHRPALGRPTETYGHQPAAMIHEVHEAYLAQRGAAMGASTLRLRWLEWHLQRTCGQHSEIGLARLKAIRDELRTRREWAP